MGNVSKCEVEYISDRKLISEVFLLEKFIVDHISNSKIHN